MREDVLVRRLDPIDARILLALDDDPRATVLGLSRQLGLARGTVQAHLERLESDGVLHRFSRRLAPAALGFSISAFVMIEIVQGQQEDTLNRLRRIPEVLEVHGITGDGDLMCRIVARDADDLYRVGQDVLSIPGVVRTRTSLAMRELVPYRVDPLLNDLAD
ncbi:Lrp/AsnC family transcriptional regulator [Kineococcus auxinigenes]|uniref:Lrp/AsnC family transcriptional regulator n=1 Tax=unclassified Kineococcus TaxID=2621656 RepID=UPI003D7E6603